MSNQNKTTLAELFKDYKGDIPPTDFEWGEDVGRERIFSISDEEYIKENGEIK